MSVYRPKRRDGTLKSPRYHYDFRLRPEGKGQSLRFHGSTGQETKRAAERVEARIRELAATGELSSAITVAEACWRYFEEKIIGQPSADDTADALEVVKRILGRDKLLVDIAPADVMTGSRKRAGERVVRRRRINGRWVKKPGAKLIQNSTVNRTFTELLRRLLRYAKRVWGVPLDLDQFDWAQYLLPEPEERVRELQEGEEERFWSALRSDYHPLVELYLISGRRKNDWIGLRRFKVDVRAGTVRIPSRKKKRPGEIVVRLTDRELEIIMGEMQKSNSEAVFTYQVQRGKEKGTRKAITSSGFRRVFANALKQAGIDDFRPHDLRHTFATRLTRATGNLKLAQKALDHADISTTAKYAHVQDEEVVAARASVTVSRNSPGRLKLTVNTKKGN